MARRIIAGSMLPGEALLPHPSPLTPHPSPLTPHPSPLIPTCSPPHPAPRPLPSPLHRAMGLMVLGFLLLLVQLDVDGDGHRATDRHNIGPHEPSELSHADVPPPRSRRDHTDLAQLTPRERRSLTCRLGEAYQRWNESEGAPLSVCPSRPLALSSISALGRR